MFSLELVIARHVKGHSSVTLTICSQGGRLASMDFGHQFYVLFASISGPLVK